MVRFALRGEAREGHVVRMPPGSKEVTPAPVAGADTVAQAQDVLVGTVGQAAALIIATAAEEALPAPSKHSKDCATVLQSNSTCDVEARGYDEQWEVLSPTSLGCDTLWDLTSDAYSGTQGQDLGTDADAAAAGASAADSEGCRGTRGSERLRGQVGFSLSQAAATDLESVRSDSASVVTWPSQSGLPELDAGCEGQPKAASAAPASLPTTPVTKSSAPVSDSCGIDDQLARVGTSRPPGQELPSRFEVGKPRPPGQELPSWFEPTPPSARPPGTRRRSGRKAMRQQFSEMNESLNALHDDYDRLHSEVTRMEMVMRDVYEVDLSVAESIGAEDVKQLLATVGHLAADQCHVRR